MASDSTADASTLGGSDTHASAQPDEPALGDPGKKALDAERQARRDAEKQLKEVSARLSEYEDRNKTELEKLQEQVAERDRQLGELPSQVRKQAIRFASLATSAGFVDPEDALLNISDRVDIADEAAVTAALGDLAERKPHLVREQPAKKPPSRPKVPASTTATQPADGGLTGKERAAAALRQFRNS